MSLTGRSMFRVLRWVGLAAVAPVLWACNARTLETPHLTPEQTYGKTFQQTINRNVDMLFLVDDSSSMRLSQDNLNRNFPTFMTRLMDPPGLPNIHVAVISSDMGAGDGSVASCDSTGGKNGIFQYTARGTCTSTGLQNGATFIENVGGVANYTGALPDVFTCIAALGEGGCGFEHQFASITRALGVDGLGGPPSENAMFLRPDAYLVIVMITNEDDCSASPGQGPNNRVALFDTSVNTNVMSQLGPPANYRCNEFGHLCDDGSGTFMHPTRYAPNNDVTQTVMYPACRSNEAEPYLLGVVDTANRIKSLKADPSQVLVAAITGPAVPYVVNWKAPSTADTSCGAASCPWPVIAHSCTNASDGSFADPSVRVVEFVNQFGANGLVLPICSDNFGPSLDRIATLINAQLQPPCITQKVAMKPGTQEPDCAVVSHISNGSGGYNDKAVQSCVATGNMAPCWQLDQGGMGCNNGSIVTVKPDTTLPPSTAQNATVNCSLCDPMFPDANRGC
jgi:hypothetical protein